METTTKTDLEDFDLETRSLKKTILRMRSPKDADYYWGGRMLPSYRRPEGLV